MTGPLPEAPPRGRELAKRLAQAGRGTVHAILMYGSHMLGARPDRYSAYDFVVIVDHYGRFYRELKAHGEIHRPVFMFRFLSGILPPNVIAFTPDRGRGGLAKCLVLRRDHFARALSPRPRDHFLLGRMIQKVGLAWAAGPEEEAWVAQRVTDARMRVLDWMAPYLSGSFTAEDLGRRMLEVCYRGEIRPESGTRSEEIFQTQRDFLLEMLKPVLEGGVEEGVLRATPEGYALAAPVSWRRRLYWRWHFMRSKARASARWFKHVLTFDNWLPYVTRKVERRLGLYIELTPWERRLPLIFLWPRAVRILRGRDRAAPMREDSP
ncbi:MAG: hypothetical protein ACE5GJ_07750 [Gemmatimonadota bacterium]